jgi:hypothetical protein
LNDQNYEKPHGVSSTIPFVPEPIPRILVVESAKKLVFFYLRMEFSSIIVHL